MNRMYLVRFSFLFFAFLVFYGCTGTRVSTSDSNMRTQEQVVAPEIVEPSPAPEQEEESKEEVSSWSIYFDFDKYDIRRDMEDVVNQFAMLANQESGKDILIEGNTDEFGGDEYNFALGNKRAIAVRSALIIRGVDGSRVRIVSLGKSKPICEEKTAECYQKNRRADIKFVDPDTQ